MALEAATYISDLVTSNPPNTDGVSQADDHLRLIKSTVKATFPNITGAVTATHTDLNKLTSSGNPQFSTIELGAASDTTLSRVSAGVVAVEGVTVPLNSITNTHTALQIELGHASDTTISRSAAGVLAVEGGVIPKENRANTFTADQTFSTATIVGSGTDQFKASVSGTISSAQWGAPSAGGHFKIAYDRSLGAATITTGFLASPITTLVTDAGGNVGVGTSTALGTYGRLRVAGTGYQALNVGSDDASGVNAIFAANATTEARIGTATNHPIDFYINGTARTRLDTSGNFLITSTGGFGYGTGSGGTVTQLTSRTTGVTLNKTNGSITLFNAPNSTTFRSFTVTNSTVAATDVILLSQRSGTNIHQLIVSNVAAGSFEISHATTSGTTSEAPVINFAVIKAVTS